MKTENGIRIECVDGNQVLLATPVDGKFLILTVVSVAKDKDTEITLQLGPDACKELATAALMVGTEKENEL
jgi:hypothetical protein